MALDPAMDRKAKADPRIVKQLHDLHPTQPNLPPRGSLSTGPTTATQTNIADFCSGSDMQKAVSAILKTPVLMAFINDNNLTKYRKSFVPDWTPFAAHEFLVAEFAHELTQ